MNVSTNSSLCGVARKGSPIFPAISFPFIYKDLLFLIFTAPSSIRTAYYGYKPFVNTFLKIHIKSMDSFHLRLRKILEERGVTQLGLAEKISMSQGVVNNYCTGKREPSIYVLYLICTALDVSADYLIGLRT